MTELNGEKYKMYRLKNVTDLCSNDGLNKIEFRLTEIKSSMRFWWRALNFYENCSHMKEDEDKIFGNSDKYKSPIILKLKKKNFNFVRKRHTVGNNLSIDCFKSGGSVEFKLSLYKRKINEKEYTNKHFEFYDNLLKISLILGGVGKRSRRGCGVFKLEESNVHDNLKIKIKNYMEKLNLSVYYDFSKEEDKYFKIHRRKKYKEESDEYPYVEEILISKNFVSEKTFYNKITKAIYDTKKEKFEYKKVNKLACPVYVTCYGEENKLYPIIVKIHNTNAHDTYPDYYDKFKEVIL